MSIHTQSQIKIYPREEVDLLLLLFPVHAFNAPEVVYHWLDALPRASGHRAAVLSVSGGGEICPNTASRVSSIKKLERKGYSVIYEDMLVMPNNVLIPTPDDLAVRFLEVLPHKVELIVDNLLSGVARRAKPLLIDYFFSLFGELEKSGANKYGKKIRSTDRCTGCGWCMRNCPAGNIEIINGRAVFGDKCNICLGCLYGCPEKALDPGPTGKFMIKGGFDLKYYENKVPLNKKIDVEKLAKGYLWAGVRRYLLDESTGKER